MPPGNQLLLSGILSQIEVKGDILNGNKHRSFYWVQIYVDNQEIIKSDKIKAHSDKLSWQWGSDTKIYFSPSSVVRIELYRGFKSSAMDKFRQILVHVAQFEEQIEKLLDNSSALFELKDKKEQSVAQINMSLFLSETPNEFISDFMKKVDRDVANLKDIDGVSKLALSILGPVLQSTKTLMDTVADAHPILKISWKFISNIYDATQETEIQDQSIRELAENLREMLATANEKLDLPKIPNAVDIIKQIGQHSLQVASIMHEYTQLSYNKRTLFLSTGNLGKRIKECQSKLQALNKRFYERVQLEMNKAVKENQDMIKDVKKEVTKVKDDALEKKIIEWLWHSGPPLDFSKNYNEANKKHHGETCSWFLDDNRFGKWLHHSGFIWVYGKAGCGKTILMSLIIKKLPEANSSTGICYFFFDARDGQTDSQLYMNFIRSLIHQLCDFRHGGIPQELVNLYTKCGSSQPLDEQLEETLQKILEGFDHVFIAIDALDECLDRQRTLDWVKKLLTKSQGQTNIHLIITSRRETDISNIFHNFRGDHIDLVNSENKDIEQYITQKMKSDNLRKFDEQHQFEIKQKLLSCADGSYIALMLNEVEKCSNLAMLKTTLTEMPKDLDEIYGQILRKCDSKKALDLQRFLQFLAFSIEDVKLEELAEIITIEFTPENEPVYNSNKQYFNPIDVLELCGGLVVTVRNDESDNQSEDYVKLSHFSVKEYLMSSHVQDVFHLAKTTSQIEISKTLLLYLLETYATILNNNNIGPYNFPLKFHAKSYWHLYVQCQGVGEDNIICKLVVSLLRLGDSTGFNDKVSNILWYGRLETKTAESKMICQASVLGLCGVVKVLLREVDDITLTKKSMDGKNPHQERVKGKYSDALQAASYMGYGLVVETLLQHGADINALFGNYGTALQAASYIGHRLVVETLLQHGADVNIVGGRYGTALQAASYYGHELVIETLIKHGADVNVVGSEHGTVLQAASFYGHELVVETLIKHGADVNVVGGEYGTALQAASYYGHELVVETLIKHGADVNVVGGQYGTALQAASYRGYGLGVETLIKHGANVNVVGGEYGNALQAASFLGRELVVETLLQHGADINAVNGSYGTALQAASYSGYELLIITLLQHGADVNVVGGKYGTALQAASYRGYGLVVETLIKHGADVNVVGGEYGNALQAASFLGHELVVETLLQHGADLNVVGSEYGPALQVASYRGYGLVVETIIKHSADVNVVDGKYGTALQAASCSGYRAVVKILLQYGADVNIVGGEYGTALQAASYMGHNSVAETLLQHGADINAVNGSYGTALQAASYSGYELLIITLLQHGADVNIVGGEYGTALQAASYRGNIFVVGSLIRRGADVNVVGGKYGTALLAASYVGQYSIVDLLLKNGADVNTSASRFDNALQAACSKNHEKVIQLLLSHGAKVTSLDYLDCISNPALQVELRIAYSAHKESISNPLQTMPEN
ncbi:hypothetical protein JR316_0013506 [Psilocybe cubensis]|uniref:NACHT domain-containing protein n=2 Tax=Psilocybe cubensis TaxID=181762 RepID=A0A8H8CDL9_PSICU|nr:uncharacterized protein JR316_0013506 [Psilocybe cubensis]KAH9474191.1 hypothetical protein JR316_0013506 [Psilocybe cubensis]